MRDLRGLILIGMVWLAVSFGLIATASAVEASDLRSRLFSAGARRVSCNRVGGDPDGPEQREPG